MSPSQRVERGERERGSGVGPPIQLAFLVSPVFSMRPAHLQLFFWATQASEGKALLLAGPPGAGRISQLGFSSADHSLFRLFLGDSPLWSVSVAFAKASPVTVLPACRSRRRADSFHCLQIPVRLHPGVMPLQSGVGTADC